MAATSATTPNHPGALDYYERDQHGFFERYGDTLYLLGAMLGGLASAGAWVSERMSRLKRERIDDVMDRLLKITAEAREMDDAERMAALNVEIDRLAIDAVRYARDRDPDPGTIAAVSIAIDTARSTVKDCIQASGALNGAGRNEFQKARASGTSCIVGHSRNSMKGGCN